MTDHTDEVLIARCDYCGVSLEDYGDVGYDGPAAQPPNSERLVPNPDNTDCSPVMTWLKLCRGCVELEFPELSD